MAEELVCKQCGGPLNEDYVCTYCGTRYQKPTAQTVTINVTNNYNAPPMPQSAPEQLAPAPQQETPVPSESEQPSDSTLTESQPEQEKKESSGLTEFVNNSFGLLVLMLLGAGALIVFGVKTNNDFMLIIGLVVGAIFLFLSSKFHGGKDDSK